MEKRRLGQSDLHLAPIMLGGNVFGWMIDENTSFGILDAFVDAGFNAIDTSDSYARWLPGSPGGESETIIGNWLKRSGKRDRVLIAVTEPEETMQAYAQLIAAGKVRAIGASNMTPARLKASLEASRKLGLPRYESLQPLYNLSDRKEFETQFEPICRQEKLGVINYYSLAAGFLIGKYRSPEEGARHPGRAGRLKRYLDPRGMAILRALDKVAARHAAVPAQIALAWLIAKSTITAPIVSATSRKQLGEILKAPAIRLSSEDIAELDAAGA
jgi:aryl-alcohol dehydrogenase-like predicted oxidoreductase